MRVALEKMSEAERMFLKRLYQQTIVEDQKAQPTDEDLLEVANQWLVGTTIDSDLNAFELHMDDAINHIDSEFPTILASRGTYHYNTTSRSHSGPSGYQAANRIRSPLNRAYSGWDVVDTMWVKCRDVAQTLTEWAQDSAEIESDKQYAREAIDAYEAAFPNSSIDIDQLTTPGWTAFISLIVFAVVAGVVFFFHPDGILSW